MKLKILIAEDKPEELEYSKKVCSRIAKEEGFIIDSDSIMCTSTLSETELILQKKPFDFDIVVLDIGFGEHDLEAANISNYLKADTLAESKVIIHSGNADFKTSPEKILTAICSGAKTIAIKGDTGIHSFETQYQRIVRDIKYETIWANIGRFTPQWKRDLFRNNDLWLKLRKGKKINKIILHVDISNSTQFVIKQRSASIDDAQILDLFKTFANKTTEIIEKAEYKGIIERYSGDEVLAYFDMDEDREKSCHSVIKCAFEISSAFNIMYEELSVEYGYIDILINQNIIKPELRVLISCGEVMWILQGADSRPQLSIMTDKVAKSYRCFTHRDINYHRTIKPNHIYITHEVYRTVKTSQAFTIGPETKLDLRDFGDLKIYKLNKHE